jgi:hypothetical protein
MASRPQWGFVVGALAFRKRLTDLDSPRVLVTILSTYIYY